MSALAVRIDRIVREALEPSVLTPDARIRFALDEEGLTEAQAKDAYPEVVARYFEVFREARAAVHRPNRRYKRRSPDSAVQKPDDVA